MASKFKCDLRTSPFHVPGHPDHLEPSVQHLLKAWTNIDPPPRRAPAITPKHLRFLHLYAKQHQSLTLQTIADLTSGAFFFAFRSCKYLMVPVRGKTTLLIVGDVAFSNKTCNPITDYTTTALIEAHFVSLTFREQKNNNKNTTRTQQRNQDPLLCPVAIWSRIIIRITSSPRTSSSTLVCFLHDPNSPVGQPSKYISQQSVNYVLRLTCKLHPAFHFGYHHQDIGTHSIRSGAAMALFLADESPHRIMLLGRWSSDAFMAYIRPQVQEWTSGMSNSMLQNESFHLALSNQHHLKNNQRHHSDPAIRHDSRSLLGSLPSSFNGPNTQGLHFSQFHLFH